jgi:hypothetical protein
MDDWGDVDNPDDNNDEMWGGDISDEEKEDEQRFETTFEQEQGALASKDVAKSCGDPIPFHIKPGTKEYSLAIASKTPLERFKLNVDYVSRILTETGNEELTLTVKDRDTMCERADNTQTVGLHAKDLNALAYILGYIAYRKDCVIKKEDSGNIKKKKVGIMLRIIGVPGNNFRELKLINDEAARARSGTSFAVFPADVIRYAQMWERLR